MRRVHGLTTYGRAIAAGSGFQAALAATPNPLFRSAMLSTSSVSGPQWPSRRLSDYFGLSRTSVAAGVVGTMFFSVAASSIAQEVHAKELPKFIPKDVVLYQYEACPFCNKVKAMYFVAKKLKKKYNITDERAALYEGGTRPNLADLAVFGVLRPIRYLKSGRDMVEHTRIGEWYSRMEGAVGEPSRINE
ncbi:Prostaglandin E synthase 2 [Linum perenne]